MVSIYSINDFKFLGFALGKNKNGVFIRVHPKSWKKMKSKLKELFSRKRILLVDIYELGVTDVMVIGHTECGAQHMNMNQMVEAMKKSGIDEETINSLKYFGVDMDKWLGGFGCVEEAVAQSVTYLKTIPDTEKRINTWICNRNAHRKNNTSRIK